MGRQEKLAQISKLTFMLDKEAKKADNRFQDEQVRHQPPLTNHRRSSRRLFNPRHFSHDGRV
jgi:hypothetical protein